MLNTQFIKIAHRVFGILLMNCLIAVLFWIGPQAANARGLDDVIESGEILIGVYSDYPPYSYLENDVPKGVDVEIGKILAKKLGVKPVWVWVTPGENVEADLRNAVWKGHMVWKYDRPFKGLADVMMRIPYDEELEERSDMFVLFAPYSSETFLLAYDVQKIEQFRNYAIFGYEKISVETDSLPDFMLISMMGGRLRQQVQHYNNQSLANQALRDGKVAATIGPAGILENELSDLKNLRFVSAPMHSIAMPRKVIRCPEVKKDWTSKVEINLECSKKEASVRTSWDIGVAVRQDFRDLGYAVEDQMMNLIDDGKIAGIFESYRMNYRLPQFLQVE